MAKFAFPFPISTETLQTAAQELAQKRTDFNISVATVPNPSGEWAASLKLEDATAQFFFPTREWAQRAAKEASKNLNAPAVAA